MDHAEDQGLMRLRGFVDELRTIVLRFPAQPSSAEEVALLGYAKLALQRLLQTDDWLPESHAVSSPLTYQQHPLYRDPHGRFSVVSFVWQPGQATPVHDHTVWGLVGVLRGAESCQHFGFLDGAWRPSGDPHIVRPGEVDLVSPTLGDVHRVSNATADQVTVSIHVYGADIGMTRRHILEPGTDSSREFISGYSKVPVLLA